MAIELVQDGDEPVALFASTGTDARRCCSEYREVERRRSSSNASKRIETCASKPMLADQLKSNRVGVDSKRFAAAEGDPFFDQH